MDWIVTVLLVLLAQVQMIGAVVGAILGADEMVNALFELGYLLFEETAFVEFPDSVLRAGERIGEVLGQ